MTTDHAITAAFASRYRDGKAVNVVDGLFAIANAIENLSSSVEHLAKATESRSGDPS